MSIDLLAEKGGGSTNNLDSAESTVANGPDRDDKGRFIPGNPGRRRGSRNRLSEDFLAALRVDFQQHGAEVIAKVREEKPDVYLRVVAALVPQQLDVRVDPIDEMTDADLDQYIRQLITAVARLESLAESPAAVLPS